MELGLGLGLGLGSSGLQAVMARSVEDKVTNVLNIDAQTPMKPHFRHILHQSHHQFPLGSNLAVVRLLLLFFYRLFYSLRRRHGGSSFLVDGVPAMDMPLYLLICDGIPSNEG